MPLHPHVANGTSPALPCTPRSPTQCGRECYSPFRRQDSEQRGCKGKFASTTVAAEQPRRPPHTAVTATQDAYPMKEIVQNLPAIIKAAAPSTLGIVALMVIVLA